MNRYTQPDVAASALVTIDTARTSTSVAGNQRRRGAAQNCPRASIVEVSERDFRVVVVADAVSGLDERGQRDMANIGVAVVSTDELLGCLSKEPARSR